MKYNQLSLKEREIVARMRFEGKTQKMIAMELQRHKSTISRELQRNCLRNKEYQPHRAQWQAKERCWQSKEPLRMKDWRLAGEVRRNLTAGWSPEQIAGRLPLEHPNDSRMRVSRGTIYAWIAEDKCQGGTLHTHLRQAYKKRRKRYGAKEKRGQIKDRVGIEERPAIVDQRRRFGDWESDTVEGKGKKGYIATHVERKSRYLLAAKLPNKKARTFNCGTIRAFAGLPAGLRRTLTVDNGKEFAGFKELEKALGFKVYFAHPYSSWERGLNENTNGLLREFFPKKTDFRKVTQNELDIAVFLLNNRPRKCLNYRTPEEVLRE